MGMLVMSGPARNLVARGIVTVSPAADSIFTVPYLSDLDPGTLFRYGSLTGDPFITVDVDGLGGAGEFEPAFVAGVPVGWLKSGTGTLTRETVFVHTEPAACKFDSTGGAGATTIAKDFSVHAGEPFRFEAAAGLVTSGGPITIHVQNLRTGRYLKNDGTWTSVLTAWVSETSVPAYDDHTVTTTVEGVGACLASTVTLRITIAVPNNTVASVDAVLYKPGVNLSAWFSPHVDPLNTVELRSSSDGFVASNVLEATPTLGDVGFYSKLGSILYRRYWRTKLLGTNSTATGAVGFGEWELGYAVPLQQPPGYPMGLELVASQIRGQLNQWGGTFAVGLGSRPYPARVPLTFGFQSEAALLDFEREVFVRSQGGTPLVIVPDDTKSDVHFVRAPDRMARPRTAFTFYDVTMDFDAFPPALVLT